MSIYYAISQNNSYMIRKIIARNSFIVNKDPNILLQLIRKDFDSYTILYTLSHMCQSDMLPTMANMFIGMIDNINESNYILNLYSQDDYFMDSLKYKIANKN